MMYIFGCLVASVIVFAKDFTVMDAATVNSISKYEEYIVEHEISATQAKNQALIMNIDEMAPPAGCKACTSRERTYCLSSNFINDHCCCDKRYKEHLPFIPHTCFIGVTLCQPVALDCDEYTRLRKCCCNKLLLRSWKQKSSASVHNACLLGVYISLVIAYIVNMY